MKLAGPRLWVIPAILGLACATVPYDFDALLQADPALPKLERVEIMGTLAVQALARHAPAVAPAFRSVDSFTATSALVNFIFKNPIEQVVADPATFEVGLYSLAHQWGRTQILLDYINRYDKLITYRYKGTRRKRRSLAVSSFLLALSSASYGLANANTTPYQRLSNELGIARNQQQLQLNAQLSSLYEAQGQSYEDLRLQISQVKQQLTSYSNLLRIYVNWLFASAAEQMERKSPDAVRILEVSASM